MLEGLFGSIVAKAVAAVVASFGLFGGLAVVGVLPVLGDHASDTVAIETLAAAATPDDEVVLGTYHELPTVAAVAAQLPVVGDSVTSLPNVDGIVSNSGSAVSPIPVTGLVATLLNTVLGSVGSVTNMLPPAGVLIDSVPLEADILIPAEPSANLGTVSTALGNVSAITNQTTHIVPTGVVTGTLQSIPLADELLRTASDAIFGLLPGIGLIAG